MSKKQNLENTDKEVNINSLLPTAEELKPFLYWVFHTADKIYVEQTLGWRDNAIEEMFEAYKRRK